MSKDKSHQNHKMTFNQIREMSQMVNNAVMSRLALQGKLLDPRRDIDAECGYPKIIRVEDYHYLYNREGIAERVVHILPEESWCMDPTVHDTEQATENDSVFNEAVETLDENKNIFSYLERADKLSGVGRFGLILIGLNDGKPLDQPVEPGASMEITFIRVFEEVQVQISTMETDPTNPRFGQPTMYKVRFADIKPGNTTAQTDAIDRSVHWSRCIHLADNRKTSEICGDPRLQIVYNRVYDLRKVVSGSGEMFWKGAFPGISLETTPDVGSDVEFDKDSLDKEMFEYQNGLRRYLALAGVQAKSLAPQVADPTSHVMVQLKLIATSIGVPFRIFIGTEEAKLAGDQDQKSWNKRLKRRQDKYLTPMVLRPFFDRLIAIGVLPEPNGGRYTITWPDLNTQTDKDKAEVANIWTKALKEYITGDVDVMIPPKQYLTLIMGLSETLADELIAAAMAEIETEEDPTEEELEETE